MRRILIALLVLAMCFSFFACSKKDTTPSDFKFASLEELVNDPEFQQIFTDSEDEMFTYSVSASGNVFVYEAHAKKTYEDVEYLRNLTTKEISDKFALADLQKLLKRYGFSDVTINVQIYNGDGTLITERTLD